MEKNYTSICLGRFAEKKPAEFWCTVTMWTIRRGGDGVPNAPAFAIDDGVVVPQQILRAHRSVGESLIDIF